MRSTVLRPLVGLITTAAIGAVVILSATLFRGGFDEWVPVTVMSPRAGLVMNPDAKVQFHGVQVGKVRSIDDQPDGRAAVRLAIEPSRVPIIPDNVTVDIASTTVFGAKVVQLTLPENPSSQPIHAGQVLGTERVMVEVNTVFEQLVSVLSTVQPEKLNETLGAISAAMKGRGEQIGRSLADLDSLLTQLNPHLESLNRDLAATPETLRGYADAAPDLISILDSSTRIGHTVVEKQSDLDELLISTIGLADTGNQVLGENRGPLADAVHLLAPTTDLTNQYHAALTCGLGAIDVMANNPPLNVPGVEVLAGFFWGQERYRYPSDLPKVAAKGGPQCTDLPKVPYGKAPPFVVTDTGANPWKYANPGIVLNSDLLKQILFGPQDGPPRNSAQIGHPG